MRRRLAFVAVLLVLLIVALVLRRTAQRPQATADMPLPPFDSAGPPRIELAHIADQWQRLPFARREASYRWDAAKRRRIEINRVVLPYNSRVDALPVRHLFRDILAAPERTGILLDACPAARRSATAREAGATTFRALRAEVHRLSACADVRRSPLAAFDRAVREARRFYRERGVLPIIVVDLEVERLTPEARQSLALNFKGALQLGTQSGAFERTRVLLAAPLEERLGYRHVRVVVDRAFLVTNREPPDYYTIALDGEPPVRRRLGAAFVFDLDKPNRPVAMSIGVATATSASITTGSAALTGTLVPAYDQTWVPSCHPVAPGGEDVWITPYVFRGVNRDNRPGAPEIQRPFVILGGYDQELFGNWSRMYAAVSGLVPGGNFIQQLQAEFDVVLLEYSHVGVSLPLNAQALACVLIDINQRNQNRDGIALVGISMGGLISRLTLAGMENDRVPGINADHGVRFWATIDSPHQGAHIPLGLQFLADHFSWLPVDEIERVNDLMNSDAAREMLIEHHETPEGQSPTRTAYLNTLASWGSFPTKVGTTVALASGSLAYLWWGNGVRLDQNSFWIPGECPDQGFGGAGCVTLPEQWLPIPNAIIEVQRNTGAMYFPQDNRNGHHGLWLLNVFMDVSVAGLNGSIGFSSLDRSTQDRRVTMYHAGSGDTASTLAFQSWWSLDVLPGWVLAFVDNPSGSSRRDLRFGRPLSVMAGGWLTTSQDIFTALQSSDLGTVSGPLFQGVSGSPMPRHTFVPLWSALDISQAYLEGMYNYLTKYAGQLTWETWYGSNYFWGAALNRGVFSYEDFVDFDRLMWHFSRPGFDGRIRTYTLRSGAIVEDPVSGEPHTESVDVRPSPFNWVYFSGANLRHGFLDSAGVQFLMTRLREELTGTGASAPQPYTPPPTNYTQIAVAPMLVQPGAMLTRVIAATQAMGLAQTTEDTLVARLQAAEQAVQANDSSTAIAELNALIADAESMRGTALTSQQADNIIHAADMVIAQLS